MSEKLQTEQLADNIVDHTTKIPNHPMMHHLECILLRCTIAFILVIFHDHKYVKYAGLILCILVIILFGSKYLSFYKNDIITWKHYPTTIIAYVCASVFIALNKQELAGLLIIADALAASRMRHSAFISSYLLATTK